MTNTLTVAQVKNNEHRNTQSRIWNTLRNLEALPKVTVTMDDSSGGINKIWVWHSSAYVPGFEFQWCPGKKHYRVYIHVGSYEKEKQNAGYCICVISSSFAAMGFGMLYGFIHKNRANNKSEAVA